jgi:phosphatidate cytidylyltransferase
MFKYRLISGTVLTSIVLSSLFIEGQGGAIVFTLLALVMLAGGMREFFYMTSKIKLPGYSGISILSAASLVLLVAVPAILGKRSNDTQSLAVTACLSAVVICGFIRAMREEDLKSGLQKQLISLAGFLYIAWSLSFLMRLYFVEGIAMSGRYLLVYLVVVTKCSDIGAYCTGMTCHKLSGGKNHKIAPRLSPGKSWEGFFGGMALSVGIALYMESAFGVKLNFAGMDVITPLAAVIIGMIAATLGFIGDVCESIFKRSADVKDSGNTIPGMGGVLDVLDSLILVAPLFYLFLQISTKLV